MTPRAPRGLEGHAWAAPRNFLGLDEDLSGWEEAGAVVLPIPYEGTTSWGGGTREGPAAILEASRYVELYDEVLDATPAEIGIHTLPPVELGHPGPERAVSELRGLYADLLEVGGGRWVVGLGGEHSISSAPILAWADRLEGRLSVLQLDAHADLRDAYGGTPWSHASVMRRVVDRIESLAAVGIRALTAEERDVIRDRGLTTVFAHEMRRSGWIERTLEALGENVYVTFDVDFFDPAVLPATGTPEPGGGSWWDAMDLLSVVFRERNVVGADVVELSPRPGEAASDFTAARLVYRMIGLHAAKRAGRG